MKKFISVALAMTIAFSCVSFAYDADDTADQVYTQTFPDIPQTHWAFDFIEDLVDRSILDGYPDGKFYPNQTVSREAFAKILTLAGGVDIDDASIENSYYRDVNIYRWSYPYINAASSYMTAYSTNYGMYFKPTEDTLREDVAIAVVKLKGYDVSNVDTSSIEEMFSDFDEISEIAKPYIAVAVKEGVISGFTDGTFRPQATITRAETSTLLCKAFPTDTNDNVLEEDLEFDELEEDSPFMPYTETLNFNLPSQSCYSYSPNGDFYYVSNNKIMCVSGGKTTTVLDFANIYFENYQYELDEDSSSDRLFYFDDINVTDIAYNKGDDTIYFGMSSVDTYGNYKIARVYSIVDLQDPVFSAVYPKYATTPSVELFGTNDMLNIIVSVGSTSSFWYEIDSVTSRVNPLNSNIDNRSQLVYSNNVIYSTSPYSSNNIAQYDFGTATWSDISVINGMSDFDGFTASEDTLYISTSDAIYSLTKSGSRYAQAMFISFGEIEVLDRSALNSLTDFVFDNDGNIVFYDKSSNSVRKITIIEETEAELVLPD